MTLPNAVTKTHLDNGAQIQTFSSSFGASDPGTVTCVAFGDQ